MRTYAWILLLLILSTLESFALSTEQQWQAANTFYHQKQYDSAATHYELLARSKPQNASLYFNLGNTYYKLNNIGLAVLNYERALRIDEGYKEAKENLALSHARTSNNISGSQEIFFVSWWHNISSPNNHSMWAMLSLLSFLVGILLFIVRKYFAYSLKFGSQVNGFIFFACVLFMVPAYSSAQQFSNSDEAIVLVKDAPLMNAELKNKAASLLPEGTKVTVLTEKGSMTEIRLADGRQGWIDNKLISKI
jgi:tetratricopeptide (TPR) repeat protein